MSNAYIERWKEIYGEWQHQFPFLTEFGSQRLVFRTDIFLIGLFISRSRYGASYKVSFEVKSLWNEISNNYVNIFSLPILPQKDDGSYLFVEYGPRGDTHDILFKQLLETIDIKYGRMFEGVAEYRIINEQCDIAFSKYPESMYIAKYSYFEFKLASALYFNDSDSWNKTYSEMKKYVSRLETKNNIRKFFHTNPALYWTEWMNYVDANLTDRERLMELCERNSKLKKVSCLNKGSLISAPITPMVQLKKGSFIDKIKDLCSERNHNGIVYVPIRSEKIKRM